MYLKKYDLKEKVVSSNDIMNIIYSVNGSHNKFYSYTWKRLKNKVKIYSHYVKYVNYKGSPQPCMEILDTGQVIVKDNENGFTCSVPSVNEMIASHILLETQWRDPKLELPYDGQLIVVKTDGEDGVCITTMKYVIDSPEWHAGMVYDCIGWLPAEDVVL